MSTAATDEILELEARWCAAVTGSDTATLVELMADDFTYTHARGATDDGPAYLAGLARQPRAMTEQDLAVRVFGATAVVTGTVVNTVAAEGDGEPMSVSLRTLKVWVRGAAGWTLVASASSGRVPSQ